MAFPFTQAAPSRRVFLLQAVVATGCLSVVGGAHAAGPMVAEADPQAMSLGYKADATTVDKAKYAKYAAGQVCGNCALFQGKAADAAGGCGIFPGKQVASKGWCNAYAKKA